MSCLCRACFSAKVAKCSSLLSGLPVGAELGEVSGGWGRDRDLLLLSAEAYCDREKCWGGREAVCTRNSPE